MFDGAVGSRDREFSRLVRAACCADDIDERPGNAVLLARQIRCASGVTHGGPAPPPIKAARAASVRAPRALVDDAPAARLYDLLLAIADAAQPMPSAGDLCRRLALQPPATEKDICRWLYRLAARSLITVRGVRGAGRAVRIVETGQVIKSAHWPVMEALP